MEELWEESWEEIDSKLVRDSDGFLTDYTMYQNRDTGEFIFIFGDKDVYTPENSSPDWECDEYWEAEEWFNDYNGFDDEDDYDSVEESTMIKSSHAPVKMLNGSIDLGRFEADVRIRPDNTFSAYISYQDKPSERFDGTPEDIGRQISELIMYAADEYKAQVGINESNYVNKSSVNSAQDPYDYEGGYTEWDLIDTLGKGQTQRNLWYNEFTDIWTVTIGPPSVFYPENMESNEEYELEEEARQDFEDTHI